MSDSNEREALEAKRQRNDEQRIAAIKRWVTYIKEQPPETWGPQLNSLVDAQVQAARDSDLPAEHYRRVERSGTVDERE